MRCFAAFVLAMLCSPAALCQVNIRNNNPDTGATTVASGPTSAAFSTPYTFTAGGAAGSALTVNPSASGDLATAAFYDGLSLNGDYVPNCLCTGALAAYLPTLTLQDAFKIVGSAGQSIPWSMTLTVTPQFGTSSSNVFDNNILVTFGIGGAAAVFTGYGTQQACFDTESGGCGGLGIAGPNNMPYTLSFSGLIGSGGTLTFSVQTSGASAFVVGPTVTSVSTQFDLDPTLRLIVPAGVSVTSNSGVFPVTAVPEPGAGLMLLAGMALLWGCAGPGARSGTHSRTRATAARRSDTASRQAGTHRARR
jgi:hypothetical protein